MKSQSRFARTIWLLRSNKKDAGTIIILDALFLLTLWYSSKLMSIVVEQNKLAIQSFSSTAISALGFMTVFTVIYAMVLLAVYSGFKLAVLHTINHMLKRGHKLSFKRLYALNIYLYGSFIAAYWAVITISGWAVKFEYQRPWRVFATLAFIIVFYLLLNASSIFFAQGNELKSIWRKTGRFLMQPRKYLPVLGFSVLAFLLLYAIYYVSAPLMAGISQLFYKQYISLFTWVVIAVLYLVMIWFNRLYFFVIEG